MRSLRISALAVLAAATVACGGADQQASATDTAASAATTPAPAGTSTATVAPATGQTHIVRMVGDERGYRYEPAALTIRAGDAVKWINVSGWPHNVAFDPAQIAAAGRAQLTANMPRQISDLSSPMFVTPNEEYTVSFGNVAPGRYPYFCTPHLAMGMRAEITVQ